MSKFSREILSDCAAEIIPILRHEHWEEVGHYDDIPIDMDWDRYAAIETLGKLRVFTVRSDDDQELEGYAFYLVDKHLHYKNTTVANQDILYVRKPYRGIGRKFMAWCDEQLKKESVVTVTQHSKPWFDYGQLFEKLGYEKAETIWSRRLD